MRILHTMLRVGNLDRSIEFYSKVLGMTLLSRKDYPDGKFTLAFLGYEANPAQAEIELTYNWGVDSYERGNAFGHIALGVDNIVACCDAIRTAGGKITREPGPMKHGTTVIAFVEDPDGYKIELIEQSSRSRLFPLVLTSPPFYHPAIPTPGTLLDGGYNMSQKDTHWPKRLGI